MNATEFDAQVRTARAEIKRNLYCLRSAIEEVTENADANALPSSHVEEELISYATRLSQAVHTLRVLRAIHDDRPPVHGVVK